MYPMPTMRAIDPPACTFNDRDDKSRGTERKSGLSLSLSLSLYPSLCGLRWLHIEANSTARIIIRYSHTKEASAIQVVVVVANAPANFRSRQSEEERAVRKQRGVSMTCLHAECFNCRLMLTFSADGYQKKKLLTKTITKYIYIYIYLLRHRQTSSPPGRGREVTTAGGI